MSVEGSRPRSTSPTYCLVYCSTYSGISCDKIKDWVGGDRCPLPYKEYKLPTQSISLGNINVPDFVKSVSIEYEVALILHQHFLVLSM